MKLFLITVKLVIIIFLRQYATQEDNLFSYSSNPWLLRLIIVENVKLNCINIVRYVPDMDPPSIGSLRALNM